MIGSQMTPNDEWVDFNREAHIFTEDSVGFRAGVPSSVACPQNSFVAVPGIEANTLSFTVDFLSSSRRVPGWKVGSLGTIVDARSTIR